MPWQAIGFDPEGTQAQEGPRLGYAPIFARPKLPSNIATSFTRSDIVSIAAEPDVPQIILELVAVAAGYGLGEYSIRMIWGGREDRRRALGLCLRCGYDLRASTGVCPECGEAIQPDRV